MFGFFCRQFSIAVWPLARSPWVYCEQTISLEFFGIPKPARKPLWRRSPTVMPGLRSIIAITGVLPAIAFLAYWPISLPAVKLLVANNASAAFWGCNGVSSVITLTPWLRAFWTTGTIAVVLLGTSRMPLAPAATMLLIAVTWLALSPSYLPAAVISFTPSSEAAFWAPCFIFTKNGLVSVFVIRPIGMSLFLPELPLPLPPPPLEESLPQAATPMPPPVSASATPRTVHGRLSWIIESLLLGPSFPTRRDAPRAPRTAS